MAKKEKKPNALEIAKEHLEKAKAYRKIGPRDYAIAELQFATAATLIFIGEQLEKLVRVKWAEVKEMKKGEVAKQLKCIADRMEMNSARN